MLKSNISLVKKNDSWVPKKEQQLTAIEKHGYNLTKTLGEGAYAKVKLADSKKHNSQVAVKVINKRRAPKDFLKKFLPREVHLMHRLDHPNVIKLYEVVETSTKVYLILQLASKGDLLEYINSRPLLSEHEVRMLFCQLAAAMTYCHKEHVVHRDLKCENILIGGDGKLKISDFGFAVSTIKNRLLETFCGSYAYCCPQILRGEPYDGKKADVWSMGVVLYALGCARLPFSENDMQALVSEDFTNKIKFSKRVSKEYRDLVRWMLNTNQDERASAEQAFRSPWCMKAIKDHPELSYLDEHLNPVLVRKPSECAPQETREFEEESYPVDVKQVQAKIGEKPNRGGMVTCFTFAAPVHLAKREDHGRRHTISGFEIHDKTYRMSLRNDLLRSLAEKEMKARSLHTMEEEEKKELPKESYNRHHTRRRSTLVTDVLTAKSPSKHNLGERKASLVSDVIKFDPRTAPRRGSLAGTQQENMNKPSPGKMEFVKQKQPTEVSKRGHMPGGPQSRLKEIAKLKYTSAARAAKMAYQEAHISMTANRRLSLQAPDHYVTMRCVEQLHEFQDRNDMMEKNTSAKFKNWQKKFKIGLNQNA